jgi:hypothetical protein
MAKVVLGGLASQISGAAGGIVWSRNRAGAYIRARVHPTVSESQFALAAKANMAMVSSQWATLSDSQRGAWATWSGNNSVTDRMGMKQTLAGNAAYMRLNGRLAALGVTLIDLPPVASAPLSLTAAALTADVGAGDFQVAFAGTPLAAGLCLWCRGAVTEGLSQKYVANRLKFLGASAAALASPFVNITQPAGVAMTLLAALQSRFGTLSEGLFVSLYLSVVSATDGQISQPIACQALVTDTGVATTLAVTLTPPEAVENGAMWSVDGGVTNYESAAVVAMSAGVKSITFRAADGYTTPAPLAKTVVVHTANTASQVYTPE